MIENIETFVLGNPVLVALLTVIMILGYHWQQGLTYREFMAVHTIKSVVFPIVDKVTRNKNTLRKYLPAKAFTLPVVGRILTKLDELHGRPLVRYKNYQDDEFVVSVEKTPYEVAQVLRGNGFSPHVLGTLKIRKSGDKQQVCHSQWSKQLADQQQVEVYLFLSDSGETSVYAHVEGSILNPRKHLEAEQTDGSTMVRELFE